MREKDFQNHFQHWLQKNPPERSAVYELKMVKHGALPFDHVKEHQIEALQKAKDGVGLYHKISDMPARHAGTFRFVKPKPFDCLFVRDVEAWVVILYYKPRQTKRAMFIDVDQFCKEKALSTRKSLTESRAAEIADTVVVI